MPQSSAAIEERSHQERSEYFITEVISFVFTPYVIVILLILIYAVVCGKMSAEPL
jgi:ABC-type multidrug transport system permease subunit